MSEKTCALCGGTGVRLLSELEKGDLSRFMPRDFSWTPNVEVRCECQPKPETRRR